MVTGHFPFIIVAKPCVGLNPQDCCLAAGSGSMRLSGPALMALEAWPLLAAYGLDGVGRPGFFTQCFEVHALGDALLALMADSADCHTLHQLLADNAQLLLQHWDEMTQVWRSEGSLTH